MKEFPFSQYLFWDTNIADINLHKHKRFVIERIVTRGNKDDFQKMLSLYSEKEIKFALRMARELDPETRKFCSQYFNIPLEEMYVSAYYNR